MEKTVRVNAIDGIRGFSLFGILLANLLIFQYGLLGKDTISLFNPNGLDKWMYAIIKIMVEGSFMPIFTFLFGYSLIMMRNSLERKQLRIKWHLFRRAILLIVFGLLHSTYLWEGDILFVYGLMGVFLLPFINRKPKTLLIWGLAIFLFLAVTMIPFTKEEDDLVDSGKLKTYVEKTTKIYSHGSYIEIKDHRNNGEDPILEDEDDIKIGLIMLLLPFAVAPMFLFGMYAAKKKFLFRPGEQSKLCRIGVILLIPFGLALKGYGFNFMAEEMMMVGGIVLSLGYISLFGLIYSKTSSSVLLQMLENTGKLSLTNYIMQTVICTTIFYGYGLGLFGGIGVTWSVLLALIIFILQMCASTIYLLYFRYGPLEKIMRIGTHLSFRNKRKKQANQDSQHVAG